MHGEVGVEVAEISKVFATGGAAIGLDMHMLCHHMLVQLARGPEVHRAEGT